MVARSRSTLGSSRFRASSMGRHFDVGLMSIVVGQSISSGIIRSPFHTLMTIAVDGGKRYGILRSVSWSAKFTNDGHGKFASLFSVSLCCIDSLEIDQSTLSSCDFGFRVPSGDSSPYSMILVPS